VCVGIGDVIGRLLLRHLKVAPLSDVEAKNARISGLNKKSTAATDQGIDYHLKEDPQWIFSLPGEKWRNNLPE
jgi:hypothetical protein